MAYSNKYLFAHKFMGLGGSANLHRAQRSQLGVVIECNQRAGHPGASSSRLPSLHLVSHPPAG